MAKTFKDGSVTEALLQTAAILAVSHKKYGEELVTLTINYYNDLLSQLEAALIIEDK